MSKKIYKKGKYTEEMVISIFEKYKEKNPVPFVIEISGTPNSGKTTAIQTFEKLLKRCSAKSNKLKYKVIYEAAEKCGIKDKLSPEFNVWTANETLNSILCSYDGNYDIIVCERGLFDSLCWCSLYFKLGKLSEEEFFLINNFFSADRFIKKIDMLYIMKCDVEQSLKRENINSLTDIQGTIVNQDILSKYNNSLDEICDKYGNKVGNLMIKDTSDFEQYIINEALVSSVFNYLISKSQ